MDIRVKQDLEQAYGSLERPNWAFVTQRIEQGWYDEFVSQLGRIGAVQETTDVNDDCSRCFFVSSAGASLTLRLSLVGKYGCVHDAGGRVVSSAELPSSALGRELLSLLQSHAVEILDAASLQQQIEFDSVHKTLYEVLFSSDGAID